jgi:hypothetical protein
VARIPYCPDNRFIIVPGLSALFAGHVLPLEKSPVITIIFSLKYTLRTGLNVVDWRMRWAGHVARMGEKRNVYRLLVGKPEGKRPLGRPIRRYIDNIKMGLLEIGLNVVDWIGLAQDRYRWRALVNSVMNLRVP